MDCPAEDTLLALVEGRLPTAALAEADVHLDSCEVCREVVSVLASGSRPRPQVEVPQQLGRFRVIEKIGEGAMGAVFAGHDPQLNRQVALKRLRPEADARSQHARLLREARAMARVDHANVVRVFDVGDDDGVLYVAMEFVAGQTLRAWLAEGQSEAATLQVLIEAGQGLAAAHAKGLVHRDFKPDNVLVAANQHAKVGDFGLAGELDTAITTNAKLELSTLTATGALIGTPLYMAPEQLRGEPATEASDQFAFGVTAWEAFEGKRPFRSALTLDDLLRSLSDGPLRPRRIPVHIEAVLRRALLTEPSNRWPNLQAMLEALKPEQSRWARHAPWLGASLAVMASALAMASQWSPDSEPTDPCDSSRVAIASEWSDDLRNGVPGGPRDALDAWTRRWTTARVNVCETTTAQRESSVPFDERVHCLDRQRDQFAGIRDALREDALGRHAAALLDELPDPHSCTLGSEATVEDSAPEALEVVRRIDQGRVFLATSNIADALTLADELGANPSVAERPRLRAEVFLFRADAEREAALYERSTASAQNALFAAEEANNRRLTALAWIASVRALGAAGNMRDARQLLPHAVAAVERAGDASELREMLLRSRGNVLVGLGELHSAAQDFESVRSSIEARLGHESIALSQVYSSLGNVARLEDRLDDALVAHRRALELDRAVVAADLRVARDLHNVAGVLRRMGRLDEARAEYQASLDISVQLLGEEHPDVALTRNSMGLIEFAEGRRREARVLWERALTSLEGHQNSDAAIVHQNLALLSLAENDASAAYEQARRAIAIDSASGLVSKRLAKSEALMAQAATTLGRVDEAREILGRAIPHAIAALDTGLETDLRNQLAALPISGAPAARVRRAPNHPQELTPARPPSVEPALSSSYGARVSWD